MSDHQIGLLSVTTAVIVLALAAFVALRTGLVTVKVEAPPASTATPASSR